MVAPTAMDKRAISMRDRLRSREAELAQIQAQIAEVQMDNENINYLINALKESLNDNQKMHDIFNNYDGGVSQAIDDLLNFAAQGLKGFNSIDEILTFAYSIGDIYKNHSTLQSICWLRTFDDWYVAQ